MIPMRVGVLNVDEILKSDLPVVMLFSAADDPLCMQLLCNLKFVGESYDKMVIVSYVDIDYAIEVFIRFDVVDIPTVIIFDGGKPIVRENGFSHTYRIYELIDKAFGVLPDTSEFKVELSPWDRYPINDM